MESIKTNKKKVTCPAETTIKAMRVSACPTGIPGRWKVLILRELFQGVKRFGELQRKLQEITQKMLTQQLRELEAPTKNLDKCGH